MLHAVFIHLSGAERRSLLKLHELSDTEHHNEPVCPSETNDVALSHGAKQIWQRFPQNLLDVYDKVVLIFGDTHWSSEVSCSTSWNREARPLLHKQTSSSG